MPAIIDKPFTSSWIQALTAAVSNPLTRTIKPKLNWVDCLSSHHGDGDRVEAAEALWKFAGQVGLEPVLRIAPTEQPEWRFPDDDTFLFQRASHERPTDGIDSTGDAFEQWLRQLGLRPSEFALTAEVTGQEWASLVRKQAVRQQQAFDSTSVGTTSLMHLPCTARWDGTAWAIQFDQTPWLVLDYEDPAIVRRPDIGDIEETLLWAMSAADEALCPKHPRSVTEPERVPPWIDRVSYLAQVHQSVLQSGSSAGPSDKGSFSPLFRAAWACVWPTVYREQNLLAGKADIETVRGGIAECMSAAPDLTLWMFVFAKLVCQTATGRGLGFSVDYGS